MFCQPARSNHQEDREPERRRGREAGREVGRRILERRGREGGDDLGQPAAREERDRRRGLGRDVARVCDRPWRNTCSSSEAGRWSRPAGSTGTGEETASRSRARSPSDASARVPLRGAPAADETRVVCLANSLALACRRVLMARSLSESKQWPLSQAARPADAAPRPVPGFRPARRCLAGVPRPSHAPQRNTRARRCTAYRGIAGGPCRLGLWLIRPVRCVISGLRPKTFR
jgi:hypothetical protein